MTYRVIVTDRADEQLDNIIQYILTQYKNKDTARGILDDVLRAYEKLEYMGGSMPLCSDPYLAEKGYHKINLENHHYLLLYQIDNDSVIVSGIFHMLENYQNKL